MSLWHDTLPEMVIGRAASMGAEGGAWLERLDTMVAELENRWSIHVEQVASGGSHAFVGLAHTCTGEKRTLKIDVPDQSENEFMSAVEVLRRADGDSDCRLYAFVPEHRAVLLGKTGGNT